MVGSRCYLLQGYHFLAALLTTREGSKKYMPNKKQIDKEQAGFTLLELMVAIVVISVGILGVAALINESQVVNRRVRDKDVVYQTLNKKMELLREVPFVDVIAGDTIFNISELQNGIGLITVVNEDAPTNHLKKITVSIHWKRWGSDTTQGEIVVTYRTRDGLGVRSL